MSNLKISNSNSNVNENLNLKTKKVGKSKSNAKDESNPENSTREYISGSIERVTFHSEESGFCVLKVKVRGAKDLVTVLGNSMSVSPGEYLDASGNWVTNREYGLQFQASELRIILPSTIEGMEKYLGSGLVKGIGPHFAKRLIEAFGAKVFDIIDQSPDKLTELSGIGQFRRDKIVQSWTDQKKIREIVVFLHSHGVGTARAVRIYKTYGQNSIDRIRENPYCLASDIRGVGFKTADTLAMRLGVSRDSILRARAGVQHVLQEISGQGHCAVPLDNLVEQSVTLLEMESTLIQTALEREKADGRLIFEAMHDIIYVFLVSLHQAEMGVVVELQRLIKGDKKELKQDPNKIKNQTEWIGSNINFDKAIMRVEQETGMKLSKTQTKAVKIALENKVIIITGGPGVGKTTVVNSILKIIRTFSDRILLSAPTGRAAKRLTESTGLEAKTIHRLLEFDPKKYNFKRNEFFPLEADLLVLDEASMVDLPLMYRLLKAIPNGCGLMLVGDSDQLPSVGPGKVLNDFIESQSIPMVQLTEIFRQAASSQIIVNAHSINRGYIPKLHYEPGEITDFYFIPADSPESCYQKLFQVVTERIPKRFSLDPLREIQVLSPMNRGGLGVRALNLELQKKLNPNPSKKITRYGVTFGIGDKVIQTVNNYDKDIFNGDIGYVKDINEEDSELLLEVEGKELCYGFEDLDELSLAYATSIHKAQGSEYPAVVIILAMQHFTLLERNLIYTAVTRGKSLVVIIGQTKALALGVRTVRSGNRVTHLAERLRTAF